MTDALTPARLWKRLSFEERQRAALAFWREENSADDHLQAVLLIAQQKKFRPKTVAGLDEARQARHLASLGSLPEHLAARALVAFHLAERRPMMGAFLDALGIAHENGVIQEGETSPTRVAPAAAALARGFRRRVSPHLARCSVRTETRGGLQWRAGRWRWGHLLRLRGVAHPRAGGQHLGGAVARAGRVGREGHLTARVVEHPRELVHRVIIT